jgi:thiol:disulfide interchange protein DsbD
MPLRIPKIIFLLLALSIGVFAQIPAKWGLDSEAKGKQLVKGQAVKVVLKAEIDPGWHLYALDQPKGGPIATTIKTEPGASFEIAGEIESPKPAVKPDPNFIVDGKPLETRSFEKSASFTVPLKAVADASADSLALVVRFQLCNDTTCIPPRNIRVTFAGSEEAARSVPPTPEVKPPSTAATPAAVDPFQENGSLWAFIWLAITLGAASLLTPCVFPMIPITVSYFTNHSAGDRGKAIKLASIYSIGIIATFTVLGMLLAIFVGASGINLFAANPWINLLITAIFLFFAFNLFGAYEISIPTNVLTKLDNLTRSKEGEGSGIVGALLMGLTFTLTSFTCTSPFVGTLLVKAAEGRWQMPLVGMLAFSTVFALPFFVLAIAPQLVSRLPRAGGWMNSIKVAMGFLEVAAAMKFISNVDLIWKWGIFTRSFVLAIWIAIGIILAVYLLGKFQLSHDSKPERIGAVRLSAAILSLAISFYLLTGLLGANLRSLESFLPPKSQDTISFLGGSSQEEHKWIENNYEAALAQARVENKTVFIDFTGYTCTNCRWMEANIFIEKDVQAEMGKFVLSRLYTDGEGAVYEQQQKMEQDLFGTVALPYYAIVDANGSTIATFPGLTRDKQEFIDFLRKAQKN